MKDPAPSGETLTYSRRPLPKNLPHVVDAYNALLVNTNPSHPPSFEYWTNGTTIMLPLTVSDAAFSSSNPTAASTLTTSHNGTLPRRSSTDMNDAVSRDPRQPTVRNAILAGSLAGLASTLVMHPLDVVRTKVQTASQHVPSARRTAWKSPTRTAATDQSPAKMTQTPWRVFQRTLQTGGVRALYTGIPPVLAAQGVYKATIFGVHTFTQDWLRKHHELEQHKLGALHYRAHELSLVDTFLCGALAGGLNGLLFVTPVELVRNQMIAHESPRQAHSTGAWHVMVTSARHHGWTSLWRGATWSVARDGWGCGWFFVTMAATQRGLTRGTGTDVHGPTLATSVLAGAMAGLAYWVAALPLDTAKTWVQSAELGTSVSVTETLARTLQRDGPGGVAQQLLRGWQVALGRGMPSAAITIAVYSHAYQYLEGIPG